MTRFVERAGPIGGAVVTAHGIKFLMVIGSTATSIPGDD